MLALGAGADAQTAGPQKPATPAADAPMTGTRPTDTPTTSSRATETGPVTSSVDADRTAVATIVMNAVTEVKLCGLAIEKSDNADVRSLCRKASADDAKTALAGMQLAASIGAGSVKFEAAPDTSEVIDSLAQFTGRDFDREFLLGQIEADVNDEHALRYAAEMATDSSIKRYENTVLPTVEKHLNLAESALRRVSETAP